MSVEWRALAVGPTPFFDHGKTAAKTLNEERRKVVACENARPSVPFWRETGGAARDAARRAVRLGQEDLCQLCKSRGALIDPAKKSHPQC